MGEEATGEHEENNLRLQALGIKRVLLRVNRVAVLVLVGQRP